MGLISLPIMLRYGYDRRIASGVIAASGTLAQIIPPSLVLIVLADQLGRSVGDMYTGAVIPGLILVGLYMAFILIVSFVRPSWVPALPIEVRTLGNGITSLMVALAALLAIGYGAHVWLYESHGADADILGAVVGVVVIYLYTLMDKTLGLNTMSHLAQQVIMVLIPPLALIFLVLGTIFIGLATPTEAGAMGAIGALVMAFLKKRLNMGVMSSALQATTRLSTFVMFVLIGARVFSLTFYGVNGHVWVEELLTSVPGGMVGFLVVINVILFVLGCFLDFFEIAFIIVPLLIAPAEAFGIDLIWLGVIIGMNLQTSFLTPPFGFALFYLRSVAAKVPYVDKVTGKRMEPIKTQQIYAGASAFILIQVVMIALVVMFPQMVMHYKGPVIDPNSVTITVPSLPTLQQQPGGAQLGAPQLGAPQLGAPQLGAPQLGAPVVTPPATGN
jgi:TRAP-type mannitol/chloroaromatic compound transport system permease large subunit